jgi:prepilin-type N-terminal cleavage/methylation domain-containing protein
MYKRVSRIGLNAKGFTIVELLVSTVVFAVLLLIISIAVIQFSRVYYKGVTENNTQDTTRSIMDSIAQAIQFSGGTISDSPTPTFGVSQAFCVGNQQYSYVLGKQLVDGGAHATLVRDLAGCTSSSAPSLTDASGKELLSPNMRLVKLSVKNVAGTNLYNINVKVVYGDDDILNNPNSANAGCKSTQTGAHFCAVTDLTTTVTKRVQ